jgi:predicted O-methyltransferase YrrM
MRSLKGQLSKTWLAWGYLLLFIAITVCGQIVASSQNILLRKRNFYGCLTVRSVSTTRMLTNGITLHGVQYTSQANRRTPTSYYAINTGCGATDFLLRQRSPDKPLQYGLIGLGIGTIACYGERGDQFTFYEIDPKVKEAAEEFFTFLKDSRAAIKIVLGDARINLAKEKENQYDLLVVDAFSGDSIPVHLLTREAMQVYLRQIKPDGVILFHISNRHVNLEPVIAKLAESANLKSYILQDPKSKYAAVTASSLYEDPKQLTGRAQFNNLTLTKLMPDPNFKCWSDDYSNLFSVIKF